MPKYVVTGGCGFIGSHLVERLTATGCEVLVVDDLSTGSPANLPKGVGLLVADVGEPGVMQDALHDADGCFHLAAIASVEKANRAWHDASRVNLGGTVAVLEAARREGEPIPVVYASSAAVYGSAGDGPLSEDARTEPISAYGADKLACELHARAGWHVHRVPSVGLRFFNVFGPRQDPASPYSGVISIFAGRAARGEPIQIHGDGEQLRDFVFVEDAVRHLVAAMKRAGGGAAVYNVCGGRPVSINRLAETLMEAAGRTVPRVHVPARPGDIRCSAGDPSKAVAGLGERCRVDLAAGLARTIEWMERSAPRAAEPAGRVGVR